MKHLLGVFLLKKWMIASVQRMIFIATHQLPQALRQTTATNPHPVGSYRAFSPSQHDAAFFNAFDIKKGDSMWLDKKDRVNIW